MLLTLPTSTIDKEDHVMIIALIIGFVAVPLLMAVFYGVEQHDRQARARRRAPARKYHDITDMDINYVYDLNYNKRR